MQSNFIRGLVKVSSPSLIIFGLLSFLVLGIYAMDYYAQLNSSRFGYAGGMAMGFFLAAIIEGGRFAFLLASVRDFSIGNKRNGWLGLVASIFLVVHDLTVSWKVAHLWSPENAMAYFNLLLFLVLFGLFVEIRLVMAFSSSPVASSGSRSGRVSPKGSAAAGASGS